jgi:hypothetical protein
VSAAVAGAAEGACAVFAPRVTGAAMTAYAVPASTAPRHPARGGPDRLPERMRAAPGEPPGPGPLTRAGRALGRAWSPVRPAGLALTGAIVAAFFLAPYVVMFLSALKSNQDLFHNPARYLPTSWEWGNFAGVWKAIPLASYIGNSLIIAGASTAIVMLVSVPAAYYTARARVTAKGEALSLVGATCCSAAPYRGSAWR